MEYKKLYFIENNFSNLLVYFIYIFILFTSFYENWILLKVDERENFYFLKTM